MAAGWFGSPQGSASNHLNTIQKFQSDSHRLDIVHFAKGGPARYNDDYKKKLRCFFDHVLSDFLKEAAFEHRIRPIPPLFGNEQSADLFELFWAVSKAGGYENVSKNGLWGVVAEELGLNCRNEVSLKLIYVKYLDDLDQWLHKLIEDGNLEFRQNKYVEDLGLFPVKSESQNQDESDHCFIEMDSNDWNTKKYMLHLPSAKNADKMYAESDGKSFGGHQKSKNGNDINAIVPFSSAVKEEFCSLIKRKRESLVGMLNWLSETAKHPCLGAYEILKESCHLMECERKEFWSQALALREVRLQGKYGGFQAERSVSQKKMKMHPSMYEESAVLSHRSLDRLRCRKKSTIIESHTHPLSESFLPCKSAIHAVAELNDRSKAEIFTPLDSLAADTSDRFKDDPLRTHISVGPLYQAEVPEWTARGCCESNTKWLGTRIWPLDNDRDGSSAPSDRIGKGRTDSCGCPIPGSVECTRFHIAEKRMKLKLALGVAFYHWRFHHMGEEISLRWTFEEEERFKDMVRSSRPSMDKCFWDHASKYFPTKGRDCLVSYYFNVFLVLRRSYQNRVTPKDIDSDDDESEFGSFSCFGYEAVRVPGTKFMECAENKQCTELEQEH